MNEVNLEFEPRFEHDCDKCIFLGHYNEHDLYFCPQGGSPTVIARWSSDGPDYISGLALVKSSEVLQMAQRRAMEIGLFISYPVGGVRDPY